MAASCQRSDGAVIPRGIVALVAAGAFAFPAPARASAMPSRASPPSCARAAIEASAARRFSSKTPVTKWDIRRLDAAARDDRACLQQQRTPRGRGEALTRSIETELARAEWWKSAARSAAGTHRNFSAARGRALSILAASRRLFALDRSGPQRADRASLRRVDELFETYKEDRTSILALQPSSAAVADRERSGRRRGVKHARPPCVPDRAARVVHHVVPLYPEAARSATATGKATIRVDLDARGAVATVSVFESSGNADLDIAALAAAHKNTYAPAIARCVRVAGSALVVSKFAP